jgi:hypothetical protein
MQNKQVEPTEYMKEWVKFLNDPKVLESFSSIFGVNPISLFKTPFYDCHWFDFNNIRNEISEQVKQNKYSCLSNINSTFYIPYSHNIFLLRDACCYVTPTENGLDIQYIKLNTDRVHSGMESKFVSFSLYVDDVPQSTQSKLREGKSFHLAEVPESTLGWDWKPDGKKIITGALDYSQAYRLDFRNVMGISLRDVKEQKQFGFEKRFRDEYKLGLLAASGYLFRLLEGGKYKEKIVFSEETMSRIRDLPEKSELAFMARASDVFSEAGTLADGIYHALNLIHKHDTQVSVFTTTKDSVFKSKRRNRKGVKPLIEWRTYEYDISKPIFKLNKHTGYRGTHASPREHERRGHIRVMKKSGKQVWVNPCKVGDKALGEIHKNFVVTSNNPIGQSKEV